MAVLAPKEVRLGGWKGPVERLEPVPFCGILYKVGEARGNMVGVVGREIELAVVVVLRLSPDWRDAGRRVVIVL
jgi:hypothetical protein